MIRAYKTDITAAELRWIERLKVLQDEDEAAGSPPPQTTHGASFPAQNSEYNDGIPVADLLKHSFEDPDDLEMY